MSEKEKNASEKLFFQAFRTEMEIWQLRRDTFRERIRNGDELVQEFITNKIGDKNVIAEVNKIWGEMIKKDELHVKEKWTKKIASTRKAYEKDKQLNSESSWNSDQKVERGGFHSQTENENCFFNYEQNHEFNDWNKPTQSKNFRSQRHNTKMKNVYHLPSSTFLTML